MKSKRMKGFAFIFLGIALLTAALLLVRHNSREDELAKNSAEDAVLQLQLAISDSKVSETTNQPVLFPDEKPGTEGVPYEGQLVNGGSAAGDQTVERPTVQAPVSGSTYTENDSEEELEVTEPEAKELKTVSLNGSEYVGYLEIPSLDRKLPVIDLQYVEQMQIAPVLQKGNPFAGDAVIAAHNYESHFGPLREMTGGEKITFIDMDGEAIDYEVVEVKTITVDEADFVMENPHPLVLYTCSDVGNRRVVIQLDRVEDET